MTIEFKTTGLKEEMAKIHELGSTFDAELITELNDLGMEWRDDARANIHPVSGDLRRTTQIIPAAKNGSTFKVGVSANLDYAEHYEYGHRQEPGRYVPALGKRLKASYVKGQYTYRTARQRALVRLPKTIRAAISRAEAILNG